MQKTFIPRKMSSMIDPSIRSAHFSELDTIFKCIDKLRSSNDGGSSCLDKKCSPNTSQKPISSGVWTINYEEVKEKMDDTRIIYIHGGGFHYCSPETYAPLLSRLSLALPYKIPIFCPHYSKAPSAKFPVAIEQIENALTYMKNHDEKGNKKKANNIIMIGDSAGATLALSVILRGKETINKFISISAWTDLACTTESYERCIWKDNDNRCDPLYHSSSIKKLRDESIQMAQAYLGNIPLDHPIASPMYGNLECLPPSLFLVGKRECMIDDSRLIVEKGKRAGADVTLRIYDEMWHDWVCYAEGCGSGNELKAATDAIQEIANFAVASL